MHRRVRALRRSSGDAGRERSIIGAYVAALALFLAVAVLIFVFFGPGRR
jgi:hypothetical protein